MLTFLRKIRKSLIDSGNARKYLLYAIGEIVLVVIGILIALEINNRNLDKLNRVAESKFLVKMYQDIQADTTSLLRLTNGAKTKSYFLISILNDELTEIRNVGRRKVESIFNSRSQATFSPRDNTFNEIISSGKINIIENEDLKEQIFEYYRYVEERNDVLSSKLSD